MYGISDRLKRVIAIMATATLTLGLGACEVDPDEVGDVGDGLEQTIPAP